MTESKSLIIINLTIVECKFRRAKRTIFDKSDNKSNHSGM